MEVDMGNQKETGITSGLGDRPGLQIVDWNVGRRPQGIAGHEIADLFSLVVGPADDPGAPRFVHVRMAPGSPPRLWHSHPGWTTTFVLDGSMEIEGVSFTAGQMVLVAPNVGYGPLEPGPDGATFIEVFYGEVATTTDWDETDPRVAVYRERGWIPPAGPAPE
jgi:hypothetical protein